MTTKEENNTKKRVFYDENNSVEKIGNCLRELFLDDVVVLGIGTDRATGDTLGCLVGEFLDKRYKNIEVYGNLRDPIHAQNLHEYKDKFNKTIIAVDAALGKEESIGAIDVYDKPLKPGKGVGKDLIKLGDYYISGIVNVDNKNDLDNFEIIRSTRLCLIRDMAQVIAKGIVYGLEINNNVLNINNSDNAMNEKEKIYV